MRYRSACLQVQAVGRAGHRRHHLGLPQLPVRKEHGLLHAPFGLDLTAAGFAHPSYAIELTGFATAVVSNKTYFVPAAEVYLQVLEQLGPGSASRGLAIVQQSNAIPLRIADGLALRRRVHIAPVRAELPKQVDPADRRLRRVGTNLR